MIPDKIYIHEASAPELTLPIPYGVEYIRKDALLEWADNWHFIGASADFLYAMEVLKRHINRYEPEI